MACSNLALTRLRRTSRLALFRRQASTRGIRCARRTSGSCCCFDTGVALVRRFWRVWRFWRVDNNQLITGAMPGLLFNQYTDTCLLSELLQLAHHSGRTWSLRGAQRARRTGRCGHPLFLIGVQRRCCSHPSSPLSAQTEAGISLRSLSTAGPSTCCQPLCDPCRGVDSRAGAGDDTPSA
jgi:hypothetical protein